MKSKKKSHPVHRKVIKALKKDLIPEIPDLVGVYIVVVALAVSILAYMHFRYG
jgi:hypothetical protein